jgi:hypothetical protein
MAQITNVNLTLTEFVEGNPTQKKVEIQVTYNAVFSQAERTLITSSGLQCVENIQVLGVDQPPGTGEILVEKVLPVQTIPVTSGQGLLTVPRSRTIKVLRSLLQEDPAPFDADEIRCKIQIISIFASQFTPVKVLAG